MHIDKVHDCKMFMIAKVHPGERGGGGRQTICDVLIYVNVFIS